jgi:hypothetical protein
MKRISSMSYASLSYFCIGIIGQRIFLFVLHRADWDDGWVVPKAQHDALHINTTNWGALGFKMCSLNKS